MNLDALPHTVLLVLAAVNVSGGELEGYRLEEALFGPVRGVFAAFLALTAPYAWLALRGQRRLSLPAGWLAAATGVAGLGLLAYQVGPPTWGFAGPLLSLLVGALALAYMAWQSSMQRRMMSTTGLLHIAVGAAFMGEVLAPRPPVRHRCAGIMGPAVAVPRVSLQARQARQAEACPTGKTEPCHRDRTRGLSGPGDHRVDGCGM